MKNYNLWDIRSLKRILFMVSLFFFSLGLHATANYAQEKKLTIKESNIELQSLLKEIESKSDFSFFYSNEKINKSLKVSINASNKSILDILDQVLTGTDITYHVKDKTIILAKKDANPSKMQQRIVKGTVKDRDGLTMPGVNIVVKGTTTGVISDIDGNYSLQVPEKGAVLVFSFIGYATKEVQVGNQTMLNVELDEDAEMIDEVVVIGYGVAKKSDLTGAVGSLKSDDIIRSNPTQPAKALQGQISGMNITKKDSRPGSEFSIDIRGLGSINNSSEPLVVIDGVMGGKLSTLNPGDIEKIDVLKDASSTAIYGSRGANGVIIVTTKKGTQGKTRVDYDGYFGVKNPAHLPKMMNAQKFYQTYNDIKIQDGGKAATFTDTEMRLINSGKSTDWVDEITRSALQTGHSVALSGGNENTTHHFSAGYLNEKGNILHTGYERYNLKGTIDSRLNKYVKVGLTSYYTYSIQNTGSGEALRSAYRVRPTGIVDFSDLQQTDIAKDVNWNDKAVWMGINDKQCMNPIVEGHPDNYKNETRISSFLGNGYVEFEPIKNLTYRSSLSVSAFNSRLGEFAGPYTKTRNFKDPKASNAYDSDVSFTWDNIVTYKIKAAKHDLSVTGVQSAMKQRFEESGTNVEYLPYDSYWYALQTATDITGVSSRLDERALLSYMGRFNYTFDSKYLLTLTGRYDGSSVLAAGHKWAFFPSAALAWRAGEETFIKNLNLFSDLKLRLSYGLVGNDVVKPYSTQSLMYQTPYDFDGKPAYGYASKTLGNKNLGWEKSEEFNVGLNMGFLNNRILLDLEYYYRTTRDLIQDVKLPGSIGFGSVTTNMGKLLNTGVEITLNTVNVQNNDFRWTTNINFSSNHNEILELFGGDVTQDIGNKLFVGKSLKSHYYYEFDGIWQTNEADEAKKYKQVPGSVKVRDRNNDGEISSNSGKDDRTVLGNELPTWLAGITNTLYYKNVDFSIFMYTRQGVMYRNAMLQGTMGELGSDRYNRLDLNYWTTTNPTNDYFGVVAANPYREAIQYKDASFWRISDITLGYTLPQHILDKMNFSRTRAYVQVSNPFVFTNFVSLDPEYNSQTVNDDIPSVTFLFGLNISF